MRDPRLDFFRGVAMVIILVAHIPGNSWANWMPSRFGFSDAAEMFVFCSGMASAIAFGATFSRQGWAVGIGRTAYRVWQVYWAHVGLFLAVAASVAALDTYGDFENSYIDGLNLGPFFADPGTQLFGLFTLTYVPNYFDILPMYLVILAMIPAMIALARVHRGLFFGTSIGMWLVANLGLLPLPAEPWSDREWFFNPFGWQLIFFTGFAFMCGWLRPPPVSRVLILSAAAFIVLTTPLSSPHAVTVLEAVWPPAAEWAMETYPKILAIRTKTEFGILRFVHFLALAYFAWIAVGPKGVRLEPAGDAAGVRIWRGFVAVVRKIGQQSLAIFVFSMIFARVIGFALDCFGRTETTFGLANLGGFATLVAVAYGIAWFKSAPWKRKGERPYVPVTPAGSPRTRA